MKDPKNKWQHLWNAFKNSFLLFKRHDTATLGAALSYYTVFSMAPLIIIVISVLGALLGPEAISGEVRRQLQSVVGLYSADLIESILKAAYKPGDNLFVTLIAIVVLIIGATSVFGQLRTSLNTIWDVKPHVKQPVLKFVLSRLFSFAMIGCIAFMLLVSLAVHAGLDAFTDYLNQRLSSGSAFLIGTLNLVFSVVLTMALFMFIYRFMSDAKLRWRSVFWGSLFTTVLFIIGKYLIGFYLTKSNLGDTYGAAGSVVIILVWVFYSSQILFFGAEFTRGIAIESGVKLHPTDVKSDKESGIVNKKVQEVKK